MSVLPRNVTPMLVSVELDDVGRRKELAGLLVAGSRGELRVDEGVLDVLVAEPILDKHDVRARVQEVRGDGVLEGVEVPFVGRYVSALAVLLHDVVEGPPGYRKTPPGQEQDRRAIVSRS